MKSMTKRYFVIALALGVSAFVAAPTFAGPKKTEEQLIADLDSPNEKIVFTAMQDLEKEFPTSTKYHPKLKSMLTDNRVKIRCKAGRVLGALHAEVNETDLKNICAQIKPSNGKDEKMEGLKTLRGLKAQSVISEITPLLQDSDSFVKRDACRTLAALGDKSVVSKIEPLLKDPDAKVQKDAQDAIFALKK
jgi:HEAT repeat protein